MSAQSSITNQEFAERVDCSHSMASRLLNGQRLPGFDLLVRIGNEFEIPWDVMVDARTSGPAEFGKLLRARALPRAAEVA